MGLYTARWMCTNAQAYTGPRRKRCDREGNAATAGYLPIGTHGVLLAVCFRTIYYNTVLLLKYLFRQVKTGTVTRTTVQTMHPRVNFPSVPPKNRVLYAEHAPLRCVACRKRPSRAPPHAYVCRSMPNCVPCHNSTNTIAAVVNSYTRYQPFVCYPTTVHHVCSLRGW